MGLTAGDFTVEQEMWLKGASETMLSRSIEAQLPPPGRLCMDCGHAVSRYAHRSVCWVCERKRTDTRMTLEGRGRRKRTTTEVLAGVHKRGPA